MAPHSSTLARKIPWTEEPGGLQSMGSLRVGHYWATSLSLSFIAEGNGNPLQCSCLENPREGGAWWAAVYGVAQSRTRLKQLSSSSRVYFLDRLNERAFILLPLRVIPRATTCSKILSGSSWCYLFFFFFNTEEVHFPKINSWLGKELLTASQVPFAFHLLPCGHARFTHRGWKLFLENQFKVRV